MVTNKHEAIERKNEVIIVRVGEIITKPRKTLTMMVRERKKSER
jgi:hypothetical protein